MRAISSSSSSVRAGTSRARPSSHARPSLSSRRTVRVHAGVEIPAAFKAILAESLAREKQRVAERVGLPGLSLKDSVQSALDGAGSEGELVYPACIQLSSFLNNNRRSDLKGARVLQLRAGIGLAGITCASLGAQVLLADVDSVLPLTRYNVDANSQLFQGEGGSAEIVEMDWTQPSADVMSQSFDWVLASDDNYEVESMPQMASLFAQLLATNPSATIMMAHRQRSQELDQQLHEQFAAAGLALQPIPGTATEGDLERGDDIVVVMQVLRK